MNAEIPPTTSSAERLTETWPPAEPAHPTHPTRHVTVQLSSTRRGARLARLLAVQQLDAWGWPYDSAVSRTMGQLVAELAANAVLHGHLPGRDFRLRLSLVAEVTLRVEVVDTRGEVGLPVGAPLPPAASDAETGRGLALVAALADRWGVTAQPHPCKTVWAELDVPVR